MQHYLPERFVLCGLKFSDAALEACDRHQGLSLYPSQPLHLPRHILKGGGGRCQGQGRKIREGGKIKEGNEEEYQEVGKKKNEGGGTIRGKQWMEKSQTLILKTTTAHGYLQLQPHQ